jgi:hypothetical protein
VMRAHLSEPSTKRTAGQIIRLHKGRPTPVAVSIGDASGLITQIFSLGLITQIFSLNWLLTLGTEYTT